MKRVLYLLGVVFALFLMTCLVSCQSVQGYVEKGDLEKGEAYCETLEGDEKEAGLVLLGGEYESIGNLSKAADLYNRAGATGKLEGVLEKASLQQEASFTKLSDTTKTYNETIKKSLNMSELFDLSELCVGMIDMSVEASDSFALYLELCNSYDEKRMKEINDGFYVKEKVLQEGVTLSEKGKNLNKYTMIYASLNAGASTFSQISGKLVREEIKMQRITAAATKAFGGSYNTPKYTKTQEDFIHIAETVPAIIEKDKRIFAVLNNYHKFPDHDKDLQKMEELNTQLQEILAKLK